MLLLEYQEGQCPDGGYVACKWAVAKHENKEAVGHAFHRFAMAQAGLLGARRDARGSCFCMDGPPRTAAGPTASGIVVERRRFQSFCTKCKAATAL